MKKIRVLITKFLTTGSAFYPLFFIPLLVWLACSRRAEAQHLGVDLRLTPQKNLVIKTGQDCITFRLNGGSQTLGRFKDAELRNDTWRLNLEQDSIETFCTEESMRCNAKICKAYWENEAERLAKFVLRVKAAKELIRSDQGVAVFMGSMRIVAAQLQYPMPLFDSLATDVMQVMGRGDHKTLRESIDEGLINLALRHIRYISRGESKCDQQALDELRVCKLQKARIYDLLPKMEAYHLEFSAGLCIGSSLPEGEDANKKKFAFEKVERAIQPCFSLEAMVCKPNRKHFTEGYHGFKAGLMNTPTFYAKQKYSKYAAFEGRDWILGKITYGWVFPFEFNRFPGRYAFTTDIGAGVPFMRSSKIDSLGGNVKQRGSFKYDGWGIAFNIGIRMMMWGRWVTLQRSIYGDGRNLPFYGQWNLAICWSGGKKMKLQY